MLTDAEVTDICEKMQDEHLNSFYNGVSKRSEYTQLAAFNLLAKLTGSNEVVEWAGHDKIALSTPSKVNEETHETEFNLTKEEMEFLCMCGVFYEDDSFVMRV